MKRDHATFLIHWLESKARKPLVIRGARQVGKTWLIRDLAHSKGRQLIEFNFEKRPDLQTLFSTNDAKQILMNISTFAGHRIDPSKSILFLDEIQATPHLLEKLRWFAEDLPELPVVAAGSLLDFALAKHEFSMPVGRIGYLYLEPLSFEEFLDAIGENQLRDYLKNYELKIDIPLAIHSQLMKLIKEYLIIGGMPAAVSNWAYERSPDAINQIHFDLLATYRDDFAKYRGRMTTDRLEDVISSIPRQLGKKFVYRTVNADVAINSLKQAVDLLSKSRIAHRVFATSSNGLPLGSEADEKFFKMIMLDCGLCGAALGLSLHQLTSISEISMINNGGMAEQLVGQLLRTLTPAYVPPSSFYWHREKKGSEAEVDYIIQHENEIIPIEVKAGTTGTLKSLHQFMKEKKKKIAVRFNSDLPKSGPVILDSFQYKLLSLPFYLLGQLHRLIKIQD
jgi:uncharacterized protein